MNAVTESVNTLLQTRKGGDAWGLYLDKFSFHPGEGQAAKGDALACVCEVYRRSQESLKVAVSRQSALRDKLRQQYGEANVRVVFLKNTSRLLLHLARANPLENVGICAERITGVPIIPGTAVKGILSTWACWCQNIDEKGSFPGEFVKERKDFDGAEAELAERVLGNNTQSGSTDAGEVVFLGAWPESLPTLELDITTPHPNDGKGNPIPNPFLAVGSGTVWAFVLIAKPRHDVTAKTLLDQTETWLKEALEQMGVGAKTAAGYGRFATPSETELSELRKREVAAAEKTAKEEAARVAKQEETDTIASLQPDPAMLTILATVKNDGDLFGKVNPYKTEEGLAGFKWPGTRAEQLAVLEFCTKTAWNRVSGNKNCRKALQNLARKFNRELPA